MPRHLSSMALAFYLRDKAIQNYHNLASPEFVLNSGWRSSLSFRRALRLRAKFKHLEPHHYYKFMEVATLIAVLSTFLKFWFRRIRPRWRHTNRNRVCYIKLKRQMNSCAVSNVSVSLIVALILICSSQDLMDIWTISDITFTASPA